jgi:hypothetical protein
MKLIEYNKSMKSFDIKVWSKMLFRYNVYLNTSGIIFLLIIWAIMYTTENFINLFFFLPLMFLYVLGMNLLFFLFPKILFWLKIRIKDQKHLFRYCVYIVIVINFSLFLATVVYFHLYDKSNLHWP